MHPPNDAEFKIASMWSAYTSLVNPSSSFMCTICIKSTLSTSNKVLGQQPNNWTFNKCIKAVVRIFQQQTMCILIIIISPQEPTSDAAASSAIVFLSQNRAITHRVKQTCLKMIWGYAPFGRIFMGKVAWQGFIGITPYKYLTPPCTTYHG